MDHSFWHERWATGQTGFHEDGENEHLSRHHGVLGSGRRVLVPLCGKAVDLTYLLAYGHQVVGVELVESAVQAFFAELGGAPTVTQAGELRRYEAGGLTVLAGDFFKATRAELGAVDAVYDRAALIALPAPMRRDYAQHLRSLMPAGAPGLLVTTEYPQDKMSGPPFSVTQEELGALYPTVQVELLGEVKATSGSPRLREVGARERAYRLAF